MRPLTAHLKGPRLVGTRRLLASPPLLKHIVMIVFGLACIGALPHRATCETLEELNSQATEMSRNLISTQIQSGMQDLAGGRNINAAATFEDIWRDNDQPEMSDLRAVAGVGLCVASARANQLERARNACRNVLQMRNAPQAIKDQASRMLDKLN